MNRTLEAFTDLEIFPLEIFFPVESRGSWILGLLESCLETVHTLWLACRGSRLQASMSLHPPTGSRVSSAADSEINRSVVLRLSISCDGMTPVLFLRK